MRPQFNEWGDPRFRYDEISDTKFDFSRTKRFRSGELHEKLLKKADKKTVLPVDIQIPLADLILRNSGLIGVVLGSTAKSLLTFEGDFKSLNMHHDLDVLVLNEFAANHPYPREASIDWWVRPPENRPTNGGVNLHYDLSLRNGISVKGAMDSASAIRLKPDPLQAENQTQKAAEIRRISRLLKEQIQSASGLQLESGLYLPSPETLVAIANHCEERHENSAKNLQECLEECEGFLKTAEVDLHVDWCKAGDEERGWHKFTGKWETEIKERYKKLHKLLNEVGQGIVFGGDYTGNINKMLKRYKELYIDSYIRVEKLIEFLEHEVQAIQRHLEDVRQRRLTEGRRMSGDYSYLKIPKETDLNPALPVIPSEAVLFAKY